MNDSASPSSSSSSSPDPGNPGTSAPRRRAIVAGYGPAGRLTAEQLQRAGFEVTIVELNLGTIERQLSLDKTVVYGDISSEAILRHVDIGSADALILTIPDAEATARACEVARQLNPGIFIAARASFLSDGMLVTQAGADHVVVDEIITAEAMRSAVVDRLLS